jgi:hypothetical protein
MPAALQLPVAPDDLAELRRWARSSQMPAVLARRARILLLAADGASKYRDRRAGRGLAADRHRPGRPQTVRRLRRTEILQVTLNPPPVRLGVTHWSTRLLAASSV